MKPKYFTLARKLAENSDHKFKLGAVVVKGNRILGVGWNKLKTHPKSTHPFKTLHAECSAILNCDIGQAKGADIYVYRKLKDGTIAESKPCEHCQTLIKDSGIRRVYFSKPAYPFWDELKL